MAGAVRVRLFSGGSDLVRKQVEAAWPEAEIRTGDDGGPFEAALVWDADETELARFLARQTGLRWVHTRASGLPGGAAAALRGRDVLVTNGRGTHGLAVAEHVAALLLAHCKRLPALLGAQRERRWLTPARTEEICGKTAGVIGLGDLGGSIARVLGALGAVVLGLRRGEHPTSPTGPMNTVPAVAHTYPADRIAEFLRRLDVLVIAAPLTDRTRALIGPRELALLPRGAFVVNVGRGPILREDALLDALESGHLAGAALDVFDDEPLPASSPLWSAPNLIVTPHCADSTEQTDRRCLDLLLEQVRRYRAGLPPRNAVDLARGY